MLMPRERKRWTAEEDEILRRATSSQFKNGGRKDWHSIAAKLTDRSNKDCRKRWSKVSWEQNRGFWSAGEDQDLRYGFQRFGSRWTLIAQVVGTRTAEQCSKRWQHSLDPTRDRSEWKPAEDEKLLTAMKTYGRNWKGIEENEFPERSRTSLKNRYTIITRKRDNQEVPTLTSQSSQSTQDLETSESAKAASDGILGLEENDWMDLLMMPGPCQAGDMFSSSTSATGTLSSGATVVEDIPNEMISPSGPSPFMNFDPTSERHRYGGNTGIGELEGERQSAVSHAVPVDDFIQQDNMYRSSAHQFDFSHHSVPSLSSLRNSNHTSGGWEDIDLALDPRLTTATSDNEGAGGMVGPGHVGENSTNVSDALTTSLPAMDQRNARRTTLVLEDPASSTVHSLLEILFKTDTKVTMKAH